MDSWLKNNISNALCCYMEKGRKAGYKDKELLDVCKQTLLDLSDASRQSLKHGFNPNITLSALLKKNHDKMVERQGCYFQTVK